MSDETSEAVKARIVGRFEAVRAERDEWQELAAQLAEALRIAEQGTQTSMPYSALLSVNSVCRHALREFDRSTSKTNASRSTDA